MVDGISGAERDRAVRELTRHCGDGRLTLDELEERITLAEMATTRAELDDLFRDLPRPAPAPDPGPVLDPEPAPSYASVSPPAAPAPAPVARTAHPAKAEESEREKALGALFVIGGFVLLFNGFFWLALICWIVLPGLVLNSRRG